MVPDEHHALFNNLDKVWVLMYIIIKRNKS